MTFVSQLDVRTTCRDCGELMVVTRQDDTVHPTCEGRPSKLETLVAGWLSCTLAGDLKSATTTAEEIEAIDARPPQFARAATRYAEWGWPVFPLKPGCGITDCRYCTPKDPCGKRPAIPKSKGGQGFKDATANIDTVASWWERSTQRNIGLATGHLFDVIDIDPRHEGIRSLTMLMDKHAIPEVHGIACTASGGVHLYVKATGKGNFAGLYPGIDYRGIGGYVVAPPSWLGNRITQYTWLSMPSPLIKESEF